MKHEMIIRSRPDKENEYVCDICGEFGTIAEKYNINDRSMFVCKGCCSGGREVQRDIAEKMINYSGIRRGDY